MICLAIKIEELLVNGPKLQHCISINFKYEKTDIVFVNNSSKQIIITPTICSFEFINIYV